MSWRDIVKLEEEKLSFGDNIECPQCDKAFYNKRVLDRHIQEAHSGSKSNSAFTRRD